MSDHLQDLQRCGKRKNLELDDRPIEHKPSTKLLGVHIDEMLTWDNQIKHISPKVSNGLRMQYLARKLTDNQETLKTIYYSLVQPYFEAMFPVTSRTGHEGLFISVVGKNTTWLNVSY